MTWEIEEPFGPNYPELGAKVAKSRREAWRNPAARREHGYAVLAAIRALQRNALNREAAPIGRPQCASGTFLSGGGAILKAIREQHRRALDGAVAFDHRQRSRSLAFGDNPPSSDPRYVRRTDDDLWRQYRDAMAAKRYAATLPPPPY